MELDMILSPSIKRRRIDGRVEMAQRDIYIQEFQQGLLHVLLGTESAIGHGIDLWQANVLLFMEPNFSADEQRQTTNRLTRLGSKNQNQTIVTLSFDQTLEQKLFEANFSLVPHTEE
jgi:SNF2 family DNA or RNA helicase